MSDFSLLTADLGGSSLRVALLDHQARPLRLASHPVETHQPGPGYAEQRPEDWWRLFRDLSAEVLAGTRPAALAITGMTRSQVLVDSAGHALYPAILWRDARAVAEAEELASQADPRYGPFGPYHPLARLLWLARYESTVLGATAHVLQPKDYLAMRLTGVAGSDWVSSQPFLEPDGSAPARALFQALKLSVRLVPPLHSPGARLGVIRERLDPPWRELAGVPVHVVPMDTWCCTVGIGACQAGQAYTISGTSEVTGVLTSQRAGAEGLVGLPWGRDLWHLGGPSQAGADCLEWLAGVLDDGDQRSGRDLLAELEALPAVGDPPLFLPYLAGERTPFWDPTLRGVLFGLERQHQRAALVQALVEGVAFHSRRVLELAEQATGPASGPLRIGGGATRSPRWCQTRADVLGRAVLGTDAEEAGLAGAGLTLLHGLGHYPDLAAAQQALVGEARLFQPDPGRASRYQGLYELHRKLHRQLQPLFGELAHWRGVADP